MSTGSNKPWPKNGKSCEGHETATASEYMDKLRSRKAEVDEQLDRPRSAARAETSAILFPEQPSSGPIGEPLLEGGSTGRPSPDGPKDGGPQHGHRLARDRETKLYRPIA